MYIVIVFNDFENDKINSLCLFDAIKDMISWSCGLIKYSDVKKQNRKYRTYKSIFKILEIDKRDEYKYFPKFKKFYKKLKESYIGGLSRDVLDS